MYYELTYINTRKQYYCSWDEIYIKIYNDNDKLLLSTESYSCPDGNYRFLINVNSLLTLRCLHYLNKEKIAKFNLIKNTNMDILRSFDHNNYYNCYVMYLTPKALLNVL